jgi:hypothetical protein
MTNISKRKTPAANIRCPLCGGTQVSVKAVSVGRAHCSDCDFSNTTLSVTSNGSEGEDIFGSLLKLGLLVLGACVVGSLLDSMTESKKQVELPNYDEENWQNIFR